MVTQTKDSAEFRELRRRAEARIGQAHPINLENLSQDDIRRLFTELQTYQIELELQNEELRLTQTQLESERNKYSQLYNFAPVGYLSIDAQDIILEMNLATADLMGYERKYFVKRPITPYLTPDSLQVFIEARQRAQATEIPQVCELTLRRRDQKTLYVQARISVLCASEPPVRWQVAMTDITERKQMEQKLRQYASQLEQMVDLKIQEVETERAKALHAARLASLGEMATGVAHELNQPLTAMLFDADYLKTRAQQSLASDNPLSAEDVRAIAGGISQDIERCRRIIDHLRAFGRVSQNPAVPTDLNQIVRDSFVLLQERLRLRDIDVQQSLLPDLPPVQGNAQKLEHVFVNLITNAEYALGEMARRVAEGEVPRADYHKELEVTTSTDGQIVFVKIQDNGCGISEADFDHIFQPFFTTKPVGEGTGLGLSTSYGIVHEYGGEITFESSENAGTTFTVRFPAAT